MVAPIHADARREAKAAGERFYSTGEPCKHGHIAKRYTGTGLCAVCASLATRKVQAKKREHPNRTAARERGDMHYTGDPCKRGHVVYSVSTGKCIKCALLWTKRYHQKRPGLEASWARVRRAKDPTGHRAQVSKWYKNNRKKAAETLARWKKANIEQARAIARAGAERRRTRKAGNGGTFTLTDIAAIRMRQQGCCAGCRRSNVKLEIDHILPVKLGGSSDPHNLQLLCSSCNKSKGAKHPDDWVASTR